MVMRINLPGLVKERQKSGRERWRVRVKGDKARRILLTVTPDHPEFMEHYRAARAGIKSEVQQPPVERSIPRSLAWLTHQFEDHMAERVEAGLMDLSTAKQRGAFYARLRVEYGDKAMLMPDHKVIEVRDSMIETPGAADNMIKSIRALYAWAMKRGLVEKNPASGIGKVSRGTGAIPWSIDDLGQYRDRHRPGTMAHLALTQFMFTACRPSCAFRLGRSNIHRAHSGDRLRWQPQKRGSAPVDIPILPPLAAAYAAQNVIGPTFLLNGHGQPFASAAAFGNWFRDRVKEAGLDRRSPSGIRKAAGELMALHGATQYHIMAVHGHTQAKTSEVYTQGVNRARLASEAMDLMAAIDW